MQMVIGFVWRGVCVCAVLVTIMGNIGIKKRPKMVIGIFIYNKLITCMKYTSREKGFIRKGKGLGYTLIQFLLSSPSLKYTKNRGGTS